MLRGLVMAALIGLAGAAQAEVIFDSTFGGNSSVQGGIIGPDFSGAYPTPAWYYGQSFITDSQDRNLKSVVLDLQNLGGSGFNVSLYDNTGSGGLPGNNLTGLTGSDSPATGLNIYTGDYSLSANTTYWIVAVGVNPGRINWVGNSNVGPAIGRTIGDMHAQVAWPAGTTYWGPTTTETLHMQVNATPEPATLGLLALGGMALLTRKRQTKKA